MKHLLLTLLIFSDSILAFPQIVLTIEGTEVIDTETEVSDGVNIPRSQPTIFTYRNNSVTSVNAFGYMLQAGDEGPGDNNNNLDGELITGNKFIWKGTNEASTTHAIFTGYNINAVIKYNYLSRTPNGIQRKSNGMNDVTGVIAYNILNNPKVGIVVKGMNNVRICNNTLFCELSPLETSRGLIDIHTNLDGGVNAISTGTKIFNNVFYTRNRTLNIKIYEDVCLSGFESDYNVFWCELGEPIFEINGQTLNFTQWQSLGYDKHSVVLDPDFIDFIDFVPRKRLDYGLNLGPTLIEGLASDAKWGKVNPRTVYQNGKWQVGARIFEGLTGSISFYPNPVHDVLNVLVTDMPMSFKKLVIYDLAGRIVLKENIEQGLNIIQLPTGMLMGLYNVALESYNQGRMVKKMLFINERVED